MAESQSISVAPPKLRGHGLKPIQPGTRAGRLVVISAAEPIRRSDGRRLSMSTCRCDCGKEKTVDNKSLRTGKTKSCGCLQLEFAGLLAKTHGAAKSPEYSTWSAMWSRVRNANNKGFAHYGGRGITVCDQWKDFAVFLADMGLKPTPLHSIERRDVDGNYEPLNCYWATRVEQMNNTHRNRFVEIDGERLTMAQWSRRSGVDQETIRVRLNGGMLPRDAVWKPKRSRL